MVNEKILSDVSKKSSKNFESKEIFYNSCLYNYGEKIKPPRKKDNTCICKYLENHFPLEKILTTQFLKQE